MNETAKYDLTIIVPVFNEEDNAPALEKRLGEFLPICSRSACVLFVDDGSRDRSAELIAGICERNADMYYIRFASNCGLSAAIKAGFDAAESPLVGYIDADLQTAPEDFNKLLEYADDYELVMGIRAKRKDSAFKRLQSKIANGFRRAMTGDKAVDTGCPLKVLHTDVARRVPMFTGMHRFLPALVGLQNGRVQQVPVRHFPRVAGMSKFSLRNRLIGPMMDCFGFRWMRPRWYNYSIADTDLKPKA